VLICEVTCCPFPCAVSVLKVLGIAQPHSSCFGSSKCCFRLGADLLSLLLIQQCIDAQLEVVGIRHRSNLELDGAVLHQVEDECCISPQP